MRRTISDPERLTILEPTDRFEVRLVKGRINIVAAPGSRHVSLLASQARDGDE